MANHIRVRKLKKGFTLTELVIYILFSFIVLGIIMGIYYNFRRMYWRTTASYSIQSEIPKAVEWLRKDLTQTGLASIRVYPSSWSGNANPGFTMINAEKEEVISGKRVRHFNVSKYGTPQWNSHVFYVVVPKPVDKAEVGTPFQGKLGMLVRGEKPFDTSQRPLYPFQVSEPPALFYNLGIPTREIIRGIPLPSAPELEGMEHLKISNFKYGGFRVAFVRQTRDPNGKVIQETLTDKNPCYADDQSGGLSETTQTSELVQVNLIVMEISKQTGKLTSYSLSFQVCPRH